MTDTPQDSRDLTSDLVDDADLPSAKRQTLIVEFSVYLMDNKKWWMIPILVMIVLFGLIMLLAATSSATLPFIYTIF